MIDYLINKNRRLMKFNNEVIIEACYGFVSFGLLLFFLSYFTSEEDQIVRTLISIIAMLSIVAVMIIAAKVKKTNQIKKTTRRSTKCQK